MAQLYREESRGGRRERSFGDSGWREFAFGRWRTRGRVLARGKAASLREGLEPKYIAASSLYESDPPMAT